MAQRTQKVTVELGFKSNTAEIKRNINELAANLKEISNMQISLKGSDLDDARKAAKDLTLELQKAVNVDTGRLDLNKLTSNLKKGQKDIVGLSTELLKAGPIGQKSFLQIAQAMSQAEVPMIKINQSLKDFMDNLGRTAKYQIAQMAIQGVQGSLQNAFREAEQLNRALNDIRIVTGLDQNAMAKFAKEANKAAKELKTTTKEYAEASLIFYQQGLNEAEVTKRTETVIKLSQVTGDTAKTVSDQMTAIWNNFADGTKTLEYYADAMAKLGADTAASTSEIANGLEKFAAIADVVGLSYETAMASVATVIDKTRQSADVVGTAFKTIFARVQGLSLDGVTDDGVSLNKYSKALEKVGVDVLTASGELRDMDDILNDLGSKWEGLGKETQVAVAQVVGGARQYNQILALMDNWADVQNNINKATSSTGELNKQADIWADSYEAAAKRVEEAKARVSENFLNSDDVVNLTNAFADLITWVDKFIDSFGGVIPLALTITGLFSNKLIPIAKTGFTALATNFKTFMGNTLGTSERLIKDTQDQFNNFLESYKQGNIEDSLKAQIEWNQKLIKVKQDMANVTKYMSEQEKEKALALLSVYEENVQAAIRAQEAFREAEHEQKNTVNSFNQEEMKAAVSRQFFKDEKIESEEDQKKIKEYARGNVSGKLQEIGKKDGLQKTLSTTQVDIDKKQLEYDTKLAEYQAAIESKEKNQRRLEIEKDTSKSAVRPKKVADYTKGIIEAEGKIMDLEPVLQQLKQEIEQKKVQATNLSKQIQKAEQYELDKDFLELAESYQKSQKSVEEKQGRQTASFGSTLFEPDEGITLNEDQRKIYNQKFAFAEEEKIMLRGKEVGLEIETVKEINKKGEEVETKYVKNSIQNYEILKRKVIDYRIELEKISQINTEIEANFSKDEQEYFNAADARKEANIEKRQAAQNFETAKQEEEQSKTELRQVELLVDSAETEEAKAQAKKRVAEAQEKVNTSIANTAKAQEELNKATDKSKKAQENFTKVEEKVKKTSEKTLKVLQNNKKELIEIAKKAGLTGKELEEFTEALESAEDIKSFEKVRDQLKDLGVAVRETANGLNVLSETMQDALEQGISPEKIQRLAEAYKITEQEALKLAMAQKKAEEASEEFQQKIGSFSNKFESVVSGVGQAAAAFSGLYSSINQMFEAFEAGTSPVEKFTGVLGTIISIAPMVALAFKAIAAASKWGAQVQEKVNEKEKVSFLGTMVAKLAGHLAEGTASMNAAKVAAALAGLGILAAVGATVGIGIGTNINANKNEQAHENNTANIKAAEKSNELATATKSESQAIDELVSQYNKLSAAGEDTVAIKEDIINQTDKVIEKYKEYADTINMTAEAEGALKAAIEELETAQTLNDIEGIKKAQEKADLVIAENAKKLNDAGIAGTLGNARLNEEARDVKVVKDGIQRRVGGTGAEEEEANKILQDKMGDSATEAGKKGSRIKLRTGKPEDFIEDYNNLQDAVDEMLSSDNEAISDPSINDTLRECQELLADYKDTYDSLKSQMATGAAYNAQIAMGNTGKSISKISSYTSYKAYKQAAQENIKNSDLTEKEKEQALDSLDTQLAANSELENFTNIEKQFDTLTEKTGIDIDKYTELLEDFSAETILKVDKNIFTSPEDIRAEAQRIQKELNRKENQVKINSILSIEEVLKPEGMTEEDWEKISESEIFKDNPEAFQNFASKSYADQLAYISEEKSKLQKENEKLLKENIQSYVDTINDTTSTAAAKEQARKDLENAQKQLVILLATKRTQQEYAQNVRESDIGDIFHDVNQELEKLEKHYKDIAELQQDIFGIETIDLSEELISNLESQNEKLQERIYLNQAEAEFQKSKLSVQTKESLGIELKYDNQGNLENYDEVLAELRRREAEDQDVSAIREQFENNYNKYNQYRDAAEGDQEQIEENRRLIKEERLKTITAKVDLQLELKDMHLQKIEYDINKALENVYSSMSEDLEINFEKQFNSYGNLFTNINAEITKLNEEFAKGEIKQADYTARMKELYNQSLSNQQALDSLSDSLINLYGDNLKKAEKEISKFTSQMDNLTSKLEQYKSLFELIGESTGKSMRAVLDASVKMTKNNFDVSKQWYETSLENANKAEEAFNSYVAEKGDALDKANDKEYQALEKAWLDSREVASKAEDDMLSDATAWGTAMKEQIEFDMQEASRAIDKALTGGLGFEQLTTQMSRRSTLQEEFLTTTNKIYETTKMMRTAENAMLATDNVRAKQKLKAFADETKQLQNKDKLSKVELDIQQKKYELLLAEIALKDAENAKSMVRLTRTADGGFGYVYTADESKVAEMEQAYADAENALYNTRLEAANSYAEKRVQAQQELNQALQDLSEQYKNGEIESYDTYLSLQSELVNDYEALYGTYSDIYATAIEGDTSVANDAWTTSFSEMLLSTEEWIGSIQTYSENLNSNLSKWDEFTELLKNAVELNSLRIDDAVDKTGEKIDPLDEKLEGMTTKSNSLKTALIGEDGKSGVVGAMDGLVDAGAEFLTTKAATWLSTIGNLGTSFGTLATNIASVVQNTSGLKDITLPEAEYGDGEKETETYESGYSENFSQYYEKLKKGEEISFERNSEKSTLYNVGMEHAFNDAQQLYQSHQNARSSVVGTWNQLTVDEEIAQNENRQKEIASTGQRINSNFVSSIGNTYTLVEGGKGPDDGVVDTFSWEIARNNYSGIINDEAKKAEAKAYFATGGLGDTAITALENYDPSNKPQHNTTQYIRGLQGQGTAFNETEYKKKEKADILQFGDRDEAVKEFFNQFLDISEEKVPNYNTYFQNNQNVQSDVDKKRADFLVNYKSKMVDNNAKGTENPLVWMKDNVDFQENAILKTFITEGSGGAKNLLDFISNKTSELWRPPGKYGWKYFTPKDYLQDDNVKSINSEHLDMDTNNGYDYDLPFDILAGWVDAFDTGGYTGSWGPEGKMAMLHQKEIVLNSDDTVNFLESIKLLRSILSFIDLQATNAQFSSLLSSSHFTPSTSEVLEQNVHIDAHFDSVTDRNEIVEAFNTLVNRASQYANRKK